MRVSVSARGELRTGSEPGGRKGKGQGVGVGGQKRRNSKGVDICAEIRDGGRFPTKKHAEWISLGSQLARSRGEGERLTKRSHLCLRFTKRTVVIETAG